MTERCKVLLLFWPNGDSNKKRKHHLPDLVRLTRAAILVPAAVRVAHATQTVVVAVRAHHERNLLDAFVASDVQGAMRTGYLHHANRFVRGDVENVEKGRMGLIVFVVPLNHLVYTAGIWRRRRERIRTIRR